MTMTNLLCSVPVLLAVLAPVYGASPAVPSPQPVVRYPASEQLHYNVIWPSGLSLGEASLNVTRTSGAGGQAGAIRSELTINASVPGYQVADKYSSNATSDYCSVSFDKTMRHGTHQKDELLTFDQARNTEVRETLTLAHQPAPVGVDLGRSAAPTAACAKDALTWVSYLRNELAAGRLPQQQSVYFGHAYDISVQYRGAESVQVGGAPVNADRVDVLLHGPASELSLTAYFAQDEARTPVLFRVPLSGGTFSMELAKQQ